VANALAFGESPILGALYDMRLDVWIYYIRSVNKDRTESREDSGWSPHPDYMVVEDSFGKQGDIARRFHNAQSSLWWIRVSETSSA